MIAKMDSLWWEKYKVNLPEGKVNDVEIRPIEIDQQTADFSMLRAMLNGGRGSIVAGTYTGLYRNGELWMSDTPDEIGDHLGAIHEAEARGGRVLVNGLGLGMVVKALLAMPNVTHVDVVEIDPDVIALVGPAYASDRCTIHLADAHEIEWPSDTRWTVAWHDIWPDISISNEASMDMLEGKYDELVDWQECWGRADMDRKWNS